MLFNLPKRLCETLIVLIQMSMRVDVHIFYDIQSSMAGNDPVSTFCNATAVALGPRLALQLAANSAFFQNRQVRCTRYAEPARFLRNRGLKNGPIFSIQNTELKCRFGLVSLTP